jgi:outer membrane protein OmpA-like peptidoglycan-associated protein
MLQAKQTLYSQRLDFADVSLERALAGSTIQAGKPFALAAAGTLRVKVAGPHYFTATSNGATRLWIDDQPVTAGSPVQLDAGAHDLRVDHRHDGGSSLTLQLQMGTKPGALRALDLNRDGIAQFAPDEDGSMRVVLDEGLLFDLDRDNLKPSADRALSSIYARSIAPVPTAPVSIEGHTDATGGAQHNLDLSRRRAESVRAWLAAHGRSPSTLGIQAYGETRPRMPNDTDDHRRLNRRVELVIGTASTASDSSETTAGSEPAALPSATLAPDAAPAPPTTPAAVAIATGAANQSVLDVLHAYYRELNDGNFDANRYFEPSVERYITMMNTSTDAMNNYIRNIFPKQFKQHHFELEEGSLSEESAAQYLYVEHSRYIQAGKTQSVEKRVKVRIRLSSAGKLVFLQQFQKL